MIAMIMTKPMIEPIIIPTMAPIDLKYIRKMFLYFFYFNILDEKDFFVCVVLLCVFTFRVPCCDVSYDFHIETIFGSSLPPVVCRRVHVIFTLFVFVYV